MSTLDITGHGRFTVLTGVGGTDWVEAAAKVGAELGIDLASRVIGMRQEYDDVEGRWARLREITDRGALLVRPDRHVAWRAHDRVGDPSAALRTALLSLLGRDGS